MKYEVYTDGGYHIPSDVGAFAYVILKDGKEIKRFSQKITKETNNRAEIKAILYAIKSLPPLSFVDVYSDSQYAMGVLSGAMKAKANKDLIAEFQQYAEENFFVITYNWVKGHSGNKWNELCDQLCNEAAGTDLNSWYKKKISFNDIMNALPNLSDSDLGEIYEEIERLCKIRNLSNTQCYG